MGADLRGLPVPARTLALLSLSCGRCAPTFSAASPSPSAYHGNHYIAFILRHGGEHCRTVWAERLLHRGGRPLRQTPATSPPYDMQPVSTSLWCTPCFFRAAPTGSANTVLPCHPFCYPRAQENCQQFGVRQRLCPALQEFFAWSFVFRPICDGHNAPP